VTQHKVGTREEWLAARVDLLKAEKELTRRSDELAEQRRALPWVRVEKDYEFETEAGTVGFDALFRGRSQLMVYHFMGPGCPACSALTDGVDGSVVHLANHDVAMACVSRAPYEELHAFRERMGWSIPFASSAGSDFSFDFGTAFTDEQLMAGAEYNFGKFPPLPDPSMVPHDMPGMSAFIQDDGVIYHTYSSYARGGDILWSMYQWLDRAPLGRNETGPWFKLHDEYPKDEW